MTDRFAVLAQVEAFARRSLADLDGRHIAEQVSPDQLRQEIATVLDAAGVEPSEVVSHLIRSLDPGMVANTSGRFFGWVMGGSLPSALAADWLVSLWDQNAAIAATSPASAIVEEVVGEWLKELLGLDPSTSYAFTTGCQMSHATCLAAARNAVLAREGWNVELDGLCGAPRVRILTGSNVHASVGRSVRLLGFGSAAMEILQEGEDGTLSPSALEGALAGGDRPTIVVLQAGDLNIGAFDPLEELIPMAQAAGAWVHVDGAFGLWLRAGSARSHLTAGIDRADSIATDVHKWLNVPYDSGVAFVRHPEPHRASMRVTASYIGPREGVRDAIDWGPEWSRRARAIPLYAALRELGRDGVAELVDRTCDITREVAFGIAELPGAHLEREPLANQALIYFDGAAEATQAENDERTARVVELVNAGGEAYFTTTVYRGRRAMRLSVCNWRIDRGDIPRVIDAVRSALRTIAEQDHASER